MKPTLPPSLLLALMAAFPGPAAAEDCAPPPATPVTEPTPAAAGEPEDPSQQKIEITSDGAEYARSGVGRLLGVVVRQGNRTLTAETATFHVETRQFQVEGAVEYQDPRVRVGVGKGKG